MNSKASKTLFHLFQTGVLGLPSRDSRFVFFGAEPGFRLPEDWNAPIHAVQGFRPDFLALSRMGVAVTPRPDGEGYAAALVLARRHRGQNELDIAEAIERTEAGGLIVVGGSKEDGVASLRKRMGKLVALEGALPKYHGLAFWFRAKAKEAAQALRDANPPRLVEGRFHTAPGMFSHDRVDPGSRLLAQNLPGNIRGDIADFCAGWGYLADEISRTASDVTSLDLYEAEFEALEVARTNVRGDVPKKGFFWHDLLSEPVERRYDVIVMNPPFHRGRAADPSIGASIIRSAAKALKPGGRLIMVANRQLPYESVLQAVFPAWKETARDGAFKVLSASR
jgi:16S rRNA (guanine1207-N2)-methyltransferase